MASFDKNSNFNKDANFMQVKFGETKPVLETELNELQEIQNEARADLIRESIPSGFTKVGALYYQGMSTNPNTISFSEDSVAYVNGYKVTIPAWTVINLNAPSQDKPREDLVFLEVWKEEVASTDTVEKFGGDGQGTVANYLKDSRFSIETSHRVQLRWRLRVVDNVDFTRWREGLARYDEINTLGWATDLVLSQGANVSLPVINTGYANYAYIYRLHDADSRYGAGTIEKCNDKGLFVAGLGDTNSKTALGTLDGYVYAIPMFRVYRRPSCGYISANDYSVFSPLISPQATQRVIDGNKVASDKDQLSVTVSGNTLVNLLGTAGNCEDLSKWASYSGLVLDTTVKLFGSGSFRVNAVGTSGNVIRDIVCDQTHKYLVSAYAYMSSFTSGQNIVSAYDLGLWSTPTVAGFDTTKLNQWQRKSIIATGKSGGMRIQIGVNVASTLTSYLDGICVYDLTAIYGAGNEPSDIAQLEKELPFVDGVQSSKPIAIKATGTNLLDITTQLASKSPEVTTTNKGFIYPANLGGKVISYAPKLIYAKTYTLSFTGYTASGTAIVKWDMYPDDYLEIGWSSLNTTPTRYSYQFSATQSFVDNIGNINKTSSIRMYTDPSQNTASAINIEDIKIEESSVANAYTPYKASQVILPSSVFSDLKKIGTIGDKVDLVTKKLTKNISDWATLDGSLTWVFQSNTTGLKNFKCSNLSGIGFSGFVTGSALVIKNDGTQLVNNSGGNVADYQYLTGTYVYITASNTETGFVDSYNPTNAEIQAYFNGWKMCKSDGSAWDGVATKYWKKITDGTGVTATLPTGSYAGYTPYKMCYQLTTPIETDISDLIKGRLYVNDETTTFESEQVSSKIVQPIAITDLYGGAGSFETDSDSNGVADNITGVTNSSASIVTNDCVYGTKAQKLTSSGVISTDVGISKDFTTMVTNNKYYISYYLRVNDVSKFSATRANIYTTGTFNNGNINTLTGTISTSFKKISGIFSGDATKQRVVAGAYANTLVTNSDYIVVDGLFMIDLTATFGAGNEPTQAWCDQYLEFGTNYTAKSPTGTNALAVMRDNKDSFLGVKGTLAVIPASKYKVGEYELFYREAQETHVPPLVSTSATIPYSFANVQAVTSRNNSTDPSDLALYDYNGDGKITILDMTVASAGGLGLDLKNNSTIGSVKYGTPLINYKKHSDGALLLNDLKISMIFNGSFIATMSSGYDSWIDKFKVGDLLYWFNEVSSSYSYGVRTEPLNTLVITNVDRVARTITYSPLSGGAWNNTYKVIHQKTLSRVDLLLSDTVVDRDITSLRHQVSLTGFDYKQLLEQNFDALLRGEL